jgi:hypothetical protein
MVAACYDAPPLYPEVSQNEPLPGPSSPREDRLTRTARCCCGSLRLIATGEPTLVAACHCTECQRRTGAAFGVAAYFEKSQVRPEGEYKIYTRDGQEGRKARMYFCPECGTTVYWDADFLPTHIGVAVGTFLDPSPLQLAPFGSSPGILG